MYVSAAVVATDVCDCPFAGARAAAGAELLVDEAVGGSEVLTPAMVGRRAGSISRRGDGLGGVGGAAEAD